MSLTKAEEVVGQITAELAKPDWTSAGWYKLVQDAIDAEKAESARHIKRLISWAEQDPHGPGIEAKPWVLRELGMALGILGEIREPDESQRIIDSLTLELKASQFNHHKNNEYLLAERDKMKRGLERALALFKRWYLSHGEDKNFGTLEEDDMAKLAKPLEETKVYAALEAMKGTST